MPSPEQDIKFLRTHLELLQLEYEAMLYRVTPEDMYSEDNIPDTETPPFFERATRLAHEYGFDDRIFRDIIPGPPQDFEEFASNFEEWKKEQAEKIRKQIETIPSIIAKIEKFAEEGQKVSLTGSKASENIELPSHYVTCVKISGITHKRSDAIARSLRAHQYPVVKKAGKYYCDPQQAAVVFPKWKKHLKNQLENE